MAISGRFSDPAEEDFHGDREIAGAVGGVRSAPLSPMIARLDSVDESPELADVLSGADAATYRDLAIRIQAEAGDLKRSLKYLSIALELDPDDPAALYQRGMILQRLNQHAAAEADLSRLTRLVPDHRLGLRRLGQVLLHGLDRPSDALIPLREAVRLAPTDARAWRSLAIALQRAGDFEAANSAWARLMNLPSHTTADVLAHAEFLLSCMSSTEDAVAQLINLLLTETATDPALSLLATATRRLLPCKTSDQQLLVLRAARRLSAAWLETGVLPGKPSVRDDFLIVLAHSEDIATAIRLADCLMEQNAESSVVVTVRCALGLNSAALAFEQHNLKQGLEALLHSLTLMAGAAQGVEFDIFELTTNARDFQLCIEVLENNRPHSVPEEIINAMRSALRDHSEGSESNDSASERPRTGISAERLVSSLRNLNWARVTSTPHAYPLAQSTRKRTFIPKLQLDDSDRAAVRTFLDLARQHLSAFKLTEALSLANRAIGISFYNGGAHQVNTSALEFLGNYEAAREAAICFWLSDPLNPKALRALEKHRLKEDLNVALDLVEANLESRKWREVSLKNAIDCYLEFGRVEQAANLLSEAKRRACFSDFRDAIFIEARILQSGLQPHLAEALYSALVDDPAKRIAALRGRAECRLAQGDFDGAEADAKVVASSHMRTDIPRGFNNVLFHTSFSRGRIREAFLEARHRPFYIALQQDVNGRMVTTVEQLANAETAAVVADFGIGDEIRFSSVYGELEARTENVTVTCDPRLETIFRRSFGGLDFLPVARWREEVVISDAASRWGLRSLRVTPNLSLAALRKLEESGAFASIFDVVADLRRVPSDFSKSRAYLVPDGARRRKWSSIIEERSAPGKINVALSWRSLLTTNSRNKHYLAANELAELAKAPATFWIVQPEASLREITILRSLLPDVRVVPGLDLVNDFEDQAAFLSCMDGLVAPLNTTAELGGALGVPSLIFLRTHAACSRMLDDGADIWHPGSQCIFVNHQEGAQRLVSRIVDAICGWQLRRRLARS